MKTVVMAAALALASPAIGQSSCGRPDTVCLQVQRTNKGAAFSTPTALPKGHLEATSSGSSIRARRMGRGDVSVGTCYAGAAPPNAEAKLAKAA